MTQDAAALVALAREHAHILSTAESCTGGMIAAALTDVPGASQVLDRGFVTYSNIAKKELLGVQQSTLDAFGAVSEDVAQEMVAGAFTNSYCSIAVSVTGVAGPGGSAYKPEGMVCFGLMWENGLVTETVQFGPLGRAEIRQRTVSHALGLIRTCIETETHESFAKRSGAVRFVAEN
ncbi:MAG: CinA family protein [Pseudomonadota bacterium]